MSYSIEKEPEDIFAEEEDEEDDSVSGDEEEDMGRDDSERKAAAALTSLVGSPVTGEQGTGKQESKEFKIPLRFTKSGRKRAVPFPMKLMKVLTEEKNSDIISWMPSGKAFIVRKPKVFVAQILGRVFKSAKYSSFTRKLHRWGFMRHYRGEEAGSFYHDLFQKDRLDLCEQMTCHKMEPAKAAASKKVKQAPAIIIPSREKEVLAPRPTVVIQRDVSPRGSMTGSVSSTMLQQPRAPMASFDMAPAAPAPMQLPNGAAVDLNAAIEMEVSRRLKERINQAALSRQALIVMQQQEAKARHEQQLRYQLAMIQQQQTQVQQQRLQQQQLQQQQMQQQQLGLAPNVTAGLVRHLAALKFGPSASYKPNTSPNFQQAFGPGPVGLPPTNIQGAKTA